MKQAAIFVFAFAVLFQLYSGAYASNSTSDSSATAGSSETGSLCLASDYIDERVGITSTLRILNRINVTMEQMMDIHTVGFEILIQNVNKSDAVKKDKETAYTFIALYQAKYAEVVAAANALESSDQTATKFVELLRKGGDEVIVEIDALDLTEVKNATADSIVHHFETGFTAVLDFLAQLVLVIAM